MKKNKITVVIPLGADREIEIMPSLKQQNEKDVKVFVEIGPNISQNRNKGAFKAKTDLIAFVDAHSIVPKDWASNIISFFNKNKEIDIAGGPQLAPADESYIGKVSSYALGSIFGAGGVSMRYKERNEILDAGEFDLTSASLVCRKKSV